MSISESVDSSAHKPPKTKADYSRNVKKLKIKLARIQQEISDVEKKIKTFSDTSNDKMIALKISKFCKERRMTPEMLFRFADKYQKKIITKNAFVETISNLGIKLTKHEIMRLEYLLDEDLSGDISWHQYNSYLYAFGIKGEYSADDEFLKNALKKFDLNKILAIADENKKDEVDPSKRKRQLLNYEEFLKYCHRHMPELSDKEIASIFNRLERNGLIDLQDFIDYMKRKEEDKKRIEDMNKKKQKVKGVEPIADQSKTLKGIIKALLKYRPKDSKSSFHASQFQRLSKKLGKPRGELMQLFRQIDKRKKGSFGFNQLIQFYIQKELKGYLGFTYELMGRKICLMGDKPEDILNQYNGCRNKMTLAEFQKFMSKQFEVIEADSHALFQIVAKEEKTVHIRTILDAMKLEEGQKKIVYVKPTLWNTKGKDFFRKNSLTILFNPMLALRFCISIVEEMNKMKQTHWDDFQFGPTFEDPFGTYSLGMNIPDENVRWNTTTSINMNQFYFGSSGVKYKSSNLCVHEMFCKALSLLVEQSENYLWCKEKIDYTVREVQQQHLQKLFRGVYPLAFQSFSQYGIYVFKFFVKEKWVYVLVDNKIPCNSDNQPLFSTSSDGRHSWISLIEKAYAKVKGSYERMFEVHSNSQYLFELTRKLPLKINLPHDYNSSQIRNEVWNEIQRIHQNAKSQLYSLTSDSGAHNLIQSKVETGLSKNMLYRLLYNFELPDNSCQNYHKSHRLVLFKDLPVKNEDVWNPSWNTGQAKNKYDVFEGQIDEELKKKGSKISLKKDKNVNILNFKLFRTIFDTLFAIKSVSFEDMIILRKIVEFEEKHVCRYELNSKEQNNGRVSMLVTLLMLKSPPKAVIELKLKNSKGQLVHEERVKGFFGCCRFSFNSDLHNLEIKVKDWEKGQDHAYSMTFYMENPRYHLKELDRQLLFKFVSPFEEAHHLSIKECDEKERTFIYRNFYRSADRGRTCCC